MKVEHIGWVGNQLFLVDDIFGFEIIHLRYLRSNGNGTANFVSGIPESVISDYDMVSTGKPVVRAKVYADSCSPEERGRIKYFMVYLSNIGEVEAVFLDHECCSNYYAFPSEKEARKKRAELLREYAHEVEFKQEDKSEE